jgi:hypothetical protein
VKKTGLPWLASSKTSPTVPPPYPRSGGPLCNNPFPPPICRLQYAPTRVVLPVCIIELDDALGHRALVREDRRRVQGSFGQAGITGCNVLIGRDDADVAPCSTEVEVFGNLLLVEEAVVATAHMLPTTKFDFEIRDSVREAETALCNFKPIALHENHIPSARNEPNLKFFNHELERRPFLQSERTRIRSAG